MSSSRRAVRRRARARGGPDSARVGIEHGGLLDLVEAELAIVAGLEIRAVEQRDLAIEHEAANTHEARRELEAARALDAGRISAMPYVAGYAAISLPGVRRLMKSSALKTPRRVLARALGVMEA